MNALVKLVDRLYILLLRLHPLAAVSDFYEEMHATYQQVITESTDLGIKAIWQRMLREIIDLPGVIIRSWIFGRKAMPENHLPNDPPSPQTSWRAALISLLPLVWMGPVMLAIGYTPFWSDPQRGQWVWPASRILIAALLWAGLLIGVKQGFPRWSYPYVMGGLITLTGLAINSLRNTPLRGQQLPVLLFVVAVWTAATIRWKPFRLFWSHIRQDWTYLSYGLFALILLFSSSVDREETPQLTLLVLLPSLLTLAGALFHLRSTTRMGRVLALVVSLTVALPIQLLQLMGPPGSNTELFGLLFSGYFILLAFLLAPALISLFKNKESGQGILK